MNSGWRYTTSIVAGDGLPGFAVSLGGHHALLFGTYAYATAGEYVVRLEVKDSADQVAIAPLTVIVTSAPPEIEEFSATVGMNSVSFYDTPPILTIGVGVTVDFGLVAAASTGRQIVTYTLGCPGSNVVSSTVSVTPTGLLTASGIMREYNTVGEYVATLTVRDDEDRTDTVTVVIEVLEAI